VAHESRPAFAVWQLIRIHITNGADDTLGQGVIVQFQLPQKLNSAYKSQMHARYAFAAVNHILPEAVKLSWMHSLPLKAQSLNASVDRLWESKITIAMQVSLCRPDLIKGTQDCNLPAQ